LLIMSLSDIFSIPFLICLSLCILLIGCSSIFFYQKISQQDHKISSMIGLISTMAEENQAFRLNLSNARHVEMSNPLHNGGQRMPVNSMNDEMPELIPVSDDESSCESDSDEDSDSYSSSDAESGSDEEQNNELENADEDDDKNETHIIKITDENFNFATDDFPFDINESGSESESNTEINDDDDLEHDIEEIHEITFDMDADDKVQEHSHDNEHLEIFDFDKSQSNNIKTIHLEMEQMSSTIDEIKDVSIFKAMNNSDTENSASQTQKIMDTVDYKKMSITKLREIVSKQGVTDASKLRKPEILKLLGVEQ